MHQPFWPGRRFDQSLEMTNQEKQRAPHCKLYLVLDLHLQIHYPLHRPPLYQRSLMLWFALPVQKATKYKSMSNINNSHRLITY